MEKIRELGIFRLDFPQIYYTVSMVLRHCVSFPMPGEIVPFHVVVLELFKAGKLKELRHCRDFSRENGRFVFGMTVVNLLNVDFSG